MRSCIFVFFLLITIYNNTLAMRFDWNYPSFNLCGVRLYNVLTVLCDHDFYGLYQKDNDTCCYSPCSFRDMKAEYCSHSEVQTEYPPFNGEEEFNIWNALMVISDYDLQLSPKIIK